MFTVPLSSIELFLHLTVKKWELQQALVLEPFGAGITVPRACSMNIFSEGGAGQTGQGCQIGPVKKKKEILAVTKILDYSE